MPAWGTGRQNVVMYAHKRTYSDDVLWPQNLGAVAIDPSTAPLSLFRLAGPIPAGTPKFGWRQRQTFPVAEFGRIRHAFINAGLSTHYRRKFNSY